MGICMRLRIALKEGENRCRYLHRKYRHRFRVSAYLLGADRKVGLGHGNLAARLLNEKTKCFAFLAGHESFAAAEGAIKIAANADRVRKQPLRVILNGLGKDAAQIISRINGFTYVQTKFDYYTGKLKTVRTIPTATVRVP